MEKVKVDIVYSYNGRIYFNEAELETDKTDRATLMLLAQEYADKYLPNKTRIIEVKIR